MSDVFGIAFNNGAGEGSYLIVRRLEDGKFLESITYLQIGVVSKWTEDRESALKTVLADRKYLEKNYKNCEVIECG